jgi:Family of unknown function (DUF5675)
MKFLLTRTKCDKDGCFGELKNEKYEIVAFTAEHTWQQVDGSWAPKIAAGSYTCQRGQHQLLHMTHTFDAFMLLNVPEFMGKPVSKCLLHMGNWPQIDSDGCILVGEAIAPSNKGPMVTNSNTVLTEFMTSTKGLQTIDLEVI